MSRVQGRHPGEIEPVAEIGDLGVVLKHSSAVVKVPIDDLERVR